MQNFTSHTHTYKSHVGHGDCEINVECQKYVLIVEEKLDIRKLMATEVDDLRSHTTM